MAHFVLTAYHLQTMETFAPGDRVVAINTDLSAPICRMESLPDAYSFPDGPLNEKTVYHVEKVRSAADGHQGLFITGIRVFVGKYHVPWDSSRFRKVDALRTHAPKKRRRKVPEAQGHPPHLRVLERTRGLPGNGRAKSGSKSTDLPPYPLCPSTPAPFPLVSAHMV
jgi:hypothetical protein